MNKPGVPELLAILDAALPKAERGWKWNGHSYAVDGQDLITFNLPPRGPVRVVFHCGTKVKETKTGRRLVEDSSGYLQWPSDQRALAEFPDEQSVRDRSKWLSAFARKWVTAARG